ncbi:cell surface receptor IPT/TIG domain-containing protein [Asticcacaulis biprosthecium C19]|uniref:Cell surface receptor IPT/TIG domain-containing protein n=1 Tax=Asticcacaulis biprosthecium C19 TaxID=715226 RepID=F4QUA5_9CAUL|nr:IPT/TIG domain-containing protein [Asticcacaulis biprosthecium]EGF89405.1 cell surface receptor IPT/TIG domain-containing protein [Asticcacaulis biprosthecium C19]
MSDQSPLIVPMIVEALVVNDQVRNNGTFLRARMRYEELRACRNGQSGPASNDASFTGMGSVPPYNVAASDFHNGVYLKWRLPEAFTHGQQDSRQGATLFPKVPNRWLVLKVSGALASRRARAWIIESDYLWSAPPAPGKASDVASIYVQPAGSGDNTPMDVFIGRNIPLGAWSEPGTSLGLTAVAPGNPGFAFHQPHNNNVFSFIDVLGNAQDDIASYQVVGWFSDPSEDPLAGGFNAAMTTLGWKLPDATDPTWTARWMLVAGSVTGVCWQASKLPPSVLPSNPTLYAAVGHTSQQAFTALKVMQTTEYDTGPYMDAAALEAFQLGIFEALAKPDGAAILADRWQRSFFQVTSGGYSWHIGDAPGATASVSDTERQAEQSWLAGLNKDQAALDAAVRSLTDLQSRLHQMWWKYAAWQAGKYGTASVSGIDQTYLRTQLDPQVTGSLAHQILVQSGQLTLLAAKVPAGDTPQALQVAIQNYAAARQLPSTRILKRGAAKPFYLPNNPVILLDGLPADCAPPDMTKIVCRFPPQLITGIHLGGNLIDGSTQGLAIPQPDLSQVTGVPWSQALISALMDEFFFTDINSAERIQSIVPTVPLNAVLGALGDLTNLAGVFPAGGTHAWQANPWRPIQLHWEADYYPIDYGTTKTPNWIFEDGRYHWTGPIANTTPLAIPMSGQVQIAQAASADIVTRLGRFLSDAPDLDPMLADLLGRLLQSMTFKPLETCILAQALDGFNEQLLLEQPGVFISHRSTSVSTQPPLADLIGEMESYPPSLADLSSGAAPPGSHFQSWRSGQFTFRKLLLVDEWGQALEPLMRLPTGVPLIMPRELSADRVSRPATFTIGPITPPNMPQGNPVIESVSPQVVEAGCGPVVLTISGSGFTPQAVANVGLVSSRELPTTFVSSTLLTVALPEHLTMAPAYFEIVVVNSGAPIPLSMSNLVRFEATSWVAIDTLSPNFVLPGTGGFSLSVSGTGFGPESQVSWNGNPLPTRFVDANHLTAQVPASSVATGGTANITVSAGYQIVSSPAGTLVQLPPALLQPARLNFDLLSSHDDTVVCGPSEPDANPICGWVLVNHLDHSLVAYDALGAAMGELSSGVDQLGRQAVFWTPAPGSQYATIAQAAATVPHFGPFLQGLAGQGVQGLADFLNAIDEVLWTTLPEAEAYGGAISAAIGRPLAMVRAQLQFELRNSPQNDPSWQYTQTSLPSAISTFSFPIELGDTTRLDDGLIGYFLEDDYSQFNVELPDIPVSNSYLRGIGTNDNFIYLRFDHQSVAHLLLLVDPHAPVRARTGILPNAEISLPLRFVRDSLASIDVTFRVNGLLTEQQALKPVGVALVTPIPKETAGTWSWLQMEAGQWTEYPVVPPDAAAHLEPKQIVLRRGLLKLAAATGRPNITGTQPGT